MPDVFTKAQRSRCMSAIRGKGNKDTELRLILIFRRCGIRGWRRNQPLPGKPDFLFRKERAAVFVDGCFWHGCRAHLRMPQGNREYWVAKIGRNAERDKRITRILRRKGWAVVRIWEHELKQPERVARKILQRLGVTTLPNTKATGKKSA